MEAGRMGHRRAILALLEAFITKARAHIRVGMRAPVRIHARTLANVCARSCICARELALVLCVLRAGVRGFARVVPNWPAVVRRVSYPASVDILLGWNTLEEGGRYLAP